MSESSSSSSLYAGSASSTASANAQTPAPLPLAHLLTHSIHDALCSEKLDRCIAIQSHTSGLLTSHTTALRALTQRARDELVGVQRDLKSGQVLAKRVTHQLRDLQRCIQRCQDLARRKRPVEWQRARTQVGADNDDDDDDDQ